MQKLATKNEVNTSDLHVTYHLPPPPADRIVLKASGRPGPVGERYSHSPAPSPVPSRSRTMKKLGPTSTTAEPSRSEDAPRQVSENGLRNESHLKKQHRVSFDIGIPGYAAILWTSSKHPSGGVREQVIVREVVYLPLHLPGL
jgi:hypothetical protein